MLLVEFIIAGIVIAAGIWFIEYKFAKMQKAEEAGLPGEVHKVLEKLGATDIVSDGHQWFSFRIGDEQLWLDISNAPLIEVLIQNTIEGCTNIDIAKLVEKELTSRLASGRVVIKDGDIFICWDSILLGEDALEEGLPVIINYLFRARELFVSTYWETVALKQSNTKLVS